MKQAESGSEIKPKAGSGSENNNFGSTTLINIPDKYSTLWLCKKKFKDFCIKYDLF